MVLRRAVRAARGRWWTQSRHSGPSMSPLLLRAEEHLKPGNKDTYRHDFVPHQHLQVDEECPTTLIPPPEKEYPLHVVLDMDETLLHSYFPSRRVRYRGGAGEPPKVTARSHRFDLGEVFYVQIRPGAEELIRWLHEQGIEVILWTAGSEVYAGRITEELLPVDCLHHRIYRDDRWFDDDQVSSCYKYLTQLGRPLEKCLIVENNPYVCTPNIDNALVVEDYFDGEEDQSLFKVKRIIEGVLYGGETVPESIVGSNLVNKLPLVRRNSTDDPEHFTADNPDYFWAVPRTKVKA